MIGEIRGFAEERGVDAPAIRRFSERELARKVVHTSHETCGYLIEAEGRSIAGGVDLLLADGSSWKRRIYFAGKVGGHAAVMDVAEEARRRGVRRLVFAHIGRASIRARDRGERPPFGEWGDDGRIFEPRRWRD